MMLYLFVPSDEPMKKLPQNALVPIGISLDSCVKIAKTTFPDLQIHYIKTPRWEKDSTVSIWGNMPYSWQTGEYATAVDFNSLTGKLLQATHEKDLDVLTKTSLTLTTLHYGHYLGFFGELLYVILSIFTAVISITGFLLWWRRKV